MKTKKAVRQILAEVDEGSTPAIDYLFRGNADHNPPADELEQASKELARLKGALAQIRAITLRSFEGPPRVRRYPTS